MRCLALATGLALLALVPAAQAAVEIGQIRPAGPAGVTCTGDRTFVQSSTGTAPSYAVPPGGGVLTSWSVQGDAGTSASTALRVLRPDQAVAGRYALVGATPTRDVPADVASTFSIGPPGIPVLEGDRIGTRENGTFQCFHTTEYTGDHFRSSAGPEPALGSSMTFGNESPDGNRLNIAASLEPDADGDLLGDETQDGDDDNDGLTDASDSCPVVSAPTGDGCPPGPDEAAPVVALGPLASRVRRRALRRGLRLTLTPDEPAAFHLRLVGRLRGGRIARTGDVVVAERRLALAEGARTTRLKGGRRLVKRLRRRARLRLEIEATDARGNRSLLTRNVTVR